MRPRMFFMPMLIIAFFCAQAFAVELSVPEVEVDAGATIVVPINIDDATGLAGGDITLEYDSSIVRAISAKTTVLSSQLNAVPNEKLDGKVRLAMASLNGLDGGSGALLEIEFEVIADSGSSPLTLSQAALFDSNVNDIAVTTKDGSITIKEKEAHLPIAYSIGEFAGNVGDDVVASINADDLAGVAGGDIILKYDENILSVVDVKATGLLDGVSVVVNTETAGTINISMASAQGIVEGSGAIVNITFKCLAVGESELTFETATAFDEASDDIVVNAVGGKLAVAEKQCDTPAIREHESGSNILALQTTYDEANVHGHAYIDIWEGEFVVEAGQYLEYQIAMFSGNPTFKGAVDVVTEDGTTLRDSGTSDQNGINAHPSADLSGHARDNWYHRMISLDALVGKKIVGAMLATDSNEHLAGLFRVYVDNIQITDGDCALLAMYTDEEVVPMTGEATANGTSFAGTAGTSDFSASVVGVTPVTPAGKLTTTWGSLKK